MALSNSGGSTSVSVELYSDIGNNVGTLLSTGSTNATGPFPGLVPLATATMSPTALTSGTAYWVLLRSPGNNRWNQTGVFGRVATSLNDGATFIYTNQGEHGAFRVNAVDTAAVIPEPGSLALLTAGALGLAVCRLRRRGC
ncbi:MAG: PEP-CTERM sorting domain-containing protein [Acidobacteria bacterium]|nr:PEP-CTERM sorting domain-containing protein [Acidobacteriota bacterium]